MDIQIHRIMEAKYKVVFYTISMRVSAILTIMLLFVFFRRLNFNYNSEGHYFDEKHLIVYNQSAILTYGILAFIFLMLTIFFLLLKRKTSSSK